MTNWPHVTVVILTYDRFGELVKTISALMQHVIYPRECLHWLIVDDATLGDYAQRISNRFPLKEQFEIVVNRHNVGWGATVNKALSAVTTDYVYFTEDDYVLTRSLDLRIGVALMEEKPNLGMVRYRGSAGTNAVFHQFEADINAFIPDWREADGSYVKGKLSYLQFDGGSPTAYIYSNGPHLKHRRFHEFYGFYEEGLKLGQTEEKFAMNVKARMQAAPDFAPGIAILPEWVPMHYRHIGVTRQHTEADR